MTHHISSPIGRRILTATILASAMAFIDGSALNVALPIIQELFQASGGQLLWIVNAYLLMLAALILIGGSLGDHLGRKRIFGSGILIFSGASLLCGLSPHPTFLIAARGVQGVGAALMIPGSLAIISATIDASERGKAIGIWSSATTITTIGGPILGGFFADLGFWRGVFFINLLPAAVALMALRAVPETTDEFSKPQLDYRGALLITLSLAGLTYGLITFGEKGSTFALQHPMAWLPFLAGGFIALLAFILAERHSDYPMIDLSLFRSRTFAGANVLTMFLYGALSSTLLFLPINLIQVQGYRPREAGLVLIPFTLMLAVLSPWAGGLLDKYGPRLLLSIGPAIVGVGFAMFSLPGITGGFSDYWTNFFPAVLVLGVGMGITVSPLTTAVMAAAPVHEAGIASAINNAVSRSAQVLTTAVMGALVLILFSNALLSLTADLDLSPEVQNAVKAETNNLANAQAPEGVNEVTRQQIQKDIRWSYVKAFRSVTLVSAVMAWLSAGLAALIIEQKRRYTQAG